MNPNKTYRPITRGSLNRRFSQRRTRRNKWTPPAWPATIGTLSMEIVFFIIITLFAIGLMAQGNP